MLEHATEAVALCGTRNATDLRKDRMLSLALTRLIEIIGEAATRVSKTTRDSHPEIPWPDVIGTRNRLIHAYDEIDHDVLLETVTDDLPPLIAALSHIIGAGR